MGLLATIAARPLPNSDYSYTPSVVRDGDRLTTVHQAKPAVAARSRERPLRR